MFTYIHIYIYRYKLYPLEKDLCSPILIPFLFGAHFFRDLRDPSRGLEELREPCVYGAGLWVHCTAAPGSMAMEVRVDVCGE